VVLLAAFVISGLAMVGVGIWVGNAVTDGVGRSQLGWRADGYPATAVVVDAGPVTPSPGGDGLSAPRRGSVRWTAPDGSDRRGQVVLPAPVESGAPVPLIVGADGAAHPEAAVDGRTVGFVAGAIGALLGWMAIWVVGTAAGELLHRRDRCADVPTTERGRR